MIYLFLWIGDYLNSKKKANLLVIFIVAILSFGMSSIVALFTGDYINLEMTKINNESQKLIPVEDGNFTHNHINKVIIKNETNKTNNTTTIEENLTVDNQNKSIYFVITPPI